MAECSSSIAWIEVAIAEVSTPMALPSMPVRDIAGARDIIISVILEERRHVRSYVSAAPENLEF
ncbi:hypothetical protein BELL_0068g00230 [Botrytis elliptica]|uniref:Uncharacterized protein n=1 Tax=Botrytis elliptica TaxID=278938 RepID=A0A4Z1JY76_9HELO|nr:hypothetical protein BELL_0068g00230 [Botrytis elliptica]